MRILYLPNQYSQQRQFEKKVWVYPVRLAMEAEFYRRQGHEVLWNIPQFKSLADRTITQPEGLPFLNLPAPDRIFTGAFYDIYQAYGNYVYHPATHMQVADGCWHGDCLFCVEKENQYKVRPIEQVVNELVDCLKLGFREIFDDSGTFPDGKYMSDFCRAVDGGPIRFGCNMRINGFVDYRQMKLANFRMVLFGIESVNQRTLDILNKGVDANDILPTLKRASEAGLDVHISVMCGYSWETKEEELRTLDFVHNCLKRGIARTAQASVYAPGGVPSSSKPAFRPADIYKVAKSPEFWTHQIKKVKDFNNLKYFIRSIKQGLKERKNG